MAWLAAQLRFGNLWRDRYTKNIKPLLNSNINSYFKPVNYEEKTNGHKSFTESKQDQPLQSDNLNKQESKAKPQLIPETTPMITDVTDTLPNNNRAVPPQSILKNNRKGLVTNGLQQETRNTKSGPKNTNSESSQTGNQAQMVNKNSRKKVKINHGDSGATRKLTKSKMGGKNKYTTPLKKTILLLKLPNSIFVGSIKVNVLSMS